jgi:hypothetical protein
MAEGEQDDPIAEKKTADVSSTPTVGARQAKPRQLAPVDVEQLRSRMAETIEKAKAEDPKELRKEIAALKAELERVSKEGSVPRSTRRRRRRC